MRWPQLTDLELLVKINELGSLSKAAQHCGIAQPNASRTINRLEREIGTALLIRHANGSTLTDQGRLVARWATGLLEAGIAYNAAVASLHDKTEHEFKIMASKTIAECYAPSWLARFQQKHQNTAVKMSVYNSRQIMEKILAGDDRLALVETPNLSPGIKSVLLGYDNLAVIASPNHKWAKRKTPISLAQLAAEKLVVRENGSGTRETLEHVLAPYNPVKPDIELSSNAAVLGSVIAGAQAAVLSKRAVQAAVASGLVKEIRVTGAEQLSRPLHAVWNSGTKIFGYAKEFLTLLKN